MKDLTATVGTAEKRKAAVKSTEKTSDVAVPLAFATVAVILGVITYWLGVFGTPIIHW